MVISQDMIEQVFRTIETRNSMTNSQSIVHSDELINQLAAQMGVTKDVIKQIIEVLLDAHKILHIDIVAEDTNRGIDKIVGYVIVDLSTIRTLKNFYDSQLMIIYEKTYHKARGATSIIKELFPQIRTLNTSEIGQILNKAMMLGEYEKLVEKDYREYSHSWQEKRMLEIAREKGFHYRTSGHPADITAETSPSPDTAVKDAPAADAEKTADTPASPEDGKRAVDTSEYMEFADKKTKYPLKRLLSIYGVEFFTKIYFRKYEFSYIRKIIDDHQITSKNELMLIKGLLAAVKKNFYTDPKLSQYKEEIFLLERALTHAVFFSNSLKK